MIFIAINTFSCGFTRCNSIMGCVNVNEEWNECIVTDYDAIRDLKMRG